MFLLAGAPPSAASEFSVIDWAVVGGYFLVVVAIGLAVAKRRGDRDDFFLADRSMPTWAVAISLLATAQSAATFVGGPVEAFAGDLTYLSATVGGLVASILVAVVFVPAFYRAKVTSVYELLRNSYGSRVQMAASAMYMLGRVFASGARLFIVAIPFSLITFGDSAPQHLVVSIIIITVVAGLYTIVGGIRAVIWTDTLQAVIYIGSVFIALIVAYQMVGLSFPEIVETLQVADHANETGKLTIIDPSLDLSRPYSVWAVLTGIVLLNLAAFGCDQDLTQRLLTCRDARRGGIAVIASQLLALPIVFLFLAIGLLLWIAFQGEYGPGVVDPYPLMERRDLFINFIIHEMPVGLRGLMIAGLFAAAMSSMDSASNALASSFVADFYRPLVAANRSDDSPQSVRRERRIARLAVAIWAIVLAGFACICVYRYDASRETLIQFALGIMTYAYSGLLAVFLCATLTRTRGNAFSALLAMGVGFLTIVVFRFNLWQSWAESLLNTSMPTIAFPWQLTIATSFALGVCLMGRRRVHTSPM